MNEERFFKEGKSWVMKTIKHLVDELSIPIENIEWGPVELTDEDKNKYPIAIQASGKRKVFKFTYSEIVDVQNSKEVQQVLENRLLDFLRSFGASGKKLGSNIRVLINCGLGRHGKMGPGNCNKVG